MDPQTNIYLQYYNAQSGGQLPAFHGARRGQYGAGLGDILRGIWRTIFPIAAHGASAFLSETLRAKESGGSWGDAAKSAIAPAAHTLMGKAVEKLSESGQSGKGKHRRKRRGQRVKAQSGGSSKHRRNTYKRKGSMKHHSAKRIKFLNF